jgi:hypothetical protein
MLNESLNQRTRKMTTQSQTAVGLLSKATRDATMQLARERNLYQPENVSDEFVEIFIKAVKSTLLDNLDRIMDEWEEATKANLSNAWLQKLMETQAVEMANIAVNKL